MPAQLTGQQSQSLSAPILITGAGQRAGLELAKSFLARQQPVIFSYRSPKAGVDELLALGALGIQADFTSNQAIIDFIRQVQQATPKLRGIIHNASSWLPDVADPLQQAQAFQALFLVHQQAPLLLNMQLAPLLQAYYRTSGQLADIIHLTDDVVRRGSRKHAAYAASKAALENLTFSCAQLLAPEVKVNAIAPALLAFNQGDAPDYQHQALRKSLLGLEPGFGVLVQTVEFLLAQNHLTGAVVPLNGGRHLRS